MNIIKNGITLLVFLMPLISFSQATKLKPEITGDELKQHISFLAADSLKGRRPGMPGAESATKYIQKQLDAYGLKTSLQTFEIVTDIEFGTNNSLVLDSLNPTMQKDYRPASFSSSGEFEGLIEWAGFGFDFGQDSMIWKDYERISPEGKWALVLRGDPQPEDMNSKLIPFADDRTKAMVAKEKGAIGLILVSGQKAEPQDELPAMHFDHSVTNAGIPVIIITRKLANYLLAETGYKIEQFEQMMIQEQKPYACSLKKKLKATISVNPIKTKTSNIIGILEGSDPGLKNDYILVGAHYDHLGMGGHGSGSRMPDTIAVHNGADDNASGVASIIEMAGKLKSLKPKRSFVFVAFSSEEIGLIGSKFFVANPTIDKSRIVTMINFDMVGRLGLKDAAISVGGTGTAAQFDSLVTVLSDNRLFKIKKSADGYGPSDHASFYSANIPVLFITTGAHDDYHTPFDDVEKINFEGQKLVTDFALDLALAISNKLKKIDVKIVSAPATAKFGRKLKVTFGIIPDVTSETNNGLRVDGVRKDGPADKGGILKGDLIVAIDSHPIANIHEYMFRLSKLQPGKTCIVDVIRNNERKVLLIQF